MIQEKSVLVVIPARDGSKGVPGKNIKILKDKPLISYTIEAAINSIYVDRTIVTSDSNEIREVSRKYGADTPFNRPNEISQDESSSMDALLHCLEWIHKNEQKKYDIVILLQCTSPFRSSKHIDEALELMIEEKSNSILSVKGSEESPYWTKKIENGELVNFIEGEMKYGRRQELPKTYILNGAIYISYWDSLIESKNWNCGKSSPYIMDKQSSVDIDDMLDFEFARSIIDKRGDI